MGLLRPEGLLRILGFDVECRPLSWYGGDWVSKEITAMAWRFADQPEDKVTCVLLNDKDHWREELPRLLKRFVAVYDKADIVTGHFIRGFDLPLINGALLELGMKPLQPKLTHDTKLDLIRFSGLSKSQENLGATLGLEHQKVGMNQDNWREANRLTPKGKKLVRERVTGDVNQQLEMRATLIEGGWLNPPVTWTPGSTRPAKYHP